MKVALEGPLLFYVWKYQPWQDMPTLNLYLNHLVGELTLITVTVKRTQKNNLTKIIYNGNKYAGMSLHSWTLLVSFSDLCNSKQHKELLHVACSGESPCSWQNMRCALTTKRAILKGCSEFFMGRELTREGSAYGLTKQVLPGCNDMLSLSVKQDNANQNKLWLCIHKI